MAGQEKRAARRHDATRHRRHVRQRTTIRTSSFNTHEDFKPLIFPTKDRTVFTLQRIDLFGCTDEAVFVLPHRQADQPVIQRLRCRLVFISRRMRHRRDLFACSGAFRLTVPDSLRAPREAVGHFIFTCIPTASGNRRTTRSLSASDEPASHFHAGMPMSRQYNGYGAGTSLNAPLT